MGLSPKIQLLNLSFGRCYMEGSSLDKDMSKIIQMDKKYKK